MTNNKQIKYSIILAYLLYIGGWFILAFKVDTLTYFGILAVVGGSHMILFCLILKSTNLFTSKTPKVKHLTEEELNKMSQSY